MDFKSFKLAVFDLDGTLVEYGSEQISPATIEAIKTLRKNGVVTTIATGRGWKQTKSLVAELKIETPVLIQSGAIIIDPTTEKVIKTQPLLNEFEKKLQGIIDHSKVDQFLLADTGTYYTTKVTTSGGNWLINSSENCRITAERDYHSVIKHLFIGPEVELRQLLQRIWGLKPTPNTILWPPDQLSYDWFLEVFDPLASKGQALGWLAEYLGLALKEVIAFGDGYNDLDMLQKAGFGVAMQGAPQELLEHADLVIPGAAEEGIARLVRGKIKAS